MADPAINVEALKSEIRCAIINKKVNACPIAVRLAWHACGTYDSNDKTGGSNGATMRYEPESTDGANSGLHIVRSMLQPVFQNHPEVSNADLWALAGSAAVEFTGGPKIPAHFGRTDGPTGCYVPPNGRLPDAAQGAKHLRDVFYRMGFNDREIVCLSGAHTLGRCHPSRSGFDGPWTRNPLKFDNSFFKNLLYLDWQIKKWDGPLQYEDVDTGELMMLPTDMALRTDPEFRKYAELYAKDQDLFFRDFSEAFEKLLTLGTDVRERAITGEVSAKDKASVDFLEAAMHGSLLKVKELAKVADVHAVERSSARSALHKAAFWGHDATVKFLVDECKLNIDAKDYNGDTPLHDAVKYNHPGVVEFLLNAKADVTVKNRQEKDPLAIAAEYGYEKVLGLLKKGRSQL